MTTQHQRGLSYLCALSTVFLGCTNASESAPDKLVRTFFPTSALALIDSPPPSATVLDATADGIRVATPGHVEMLVPFHPDDALLVRHGTFEVRVREEGRTGPASLHAGAVAYGRRGGSSFWRPTPTGCEEWLVLEEGTGAGDEPVAIWNVQGAFVTQNGTSIVLQDKHGTPQLTVNAPLAYTRRGMPIWLRLEAREETIALFAQPIDEPVMIDPGWTDVASLGASSYGHQGVTLADGRVLVAGRNGTGEIYDETTNMWTPTAPLVTTHAGGAAARLMDGRVLFTGGFSNLKTAEIYDPQMDTWTAAAPMTTDRVYHTSTLLPDGRVLIAGGTVSGGSSWATAELYDPAINTWTATGSMATGRHQHTASLLTNGKVLAGGGAGAGPGTTSEIYDPATGMWTVTSAMVTQHFNAPRSVVLKDGKLLMLGANVVAGDSGLYDPVTDIWTNAGVEPSPRIYMSAALLLDGRVLAAGGYSSGGGYHKQAEIWDPQMMAWTLVDPMNHTRSEHSANRLPSGAILEAGGFDGTTFLKVAEVYKVESPAGTPCTVGPSCASGFCVDGVCCDSACDGVCQACTMAMGATSDGKCTLLSDTPCDDGDACTTNDMCSMGACTVSTPVVCNAMDACHETGTCDPQSGSCSNPVAPDGTPCPNGTCALGECMPGAGGMGGEGGMAGAGGKGEGGMGGTGNAGGDGGIGGEAGGGTGGGPVQDDSGCGCRMADAQHERGSAIALAFVLAGLRWRRRTAKR